MHRGMIIAFALLIFSLASIFFRCWKNITMDMQMSVKFLKPVSHKALLCLMKVILHWLIDIAFLQVYFSYQLLRWLWYPVSYYLWLPGENDLVTKILFNWAQWVLSYIEHITPATPDSPERCLFSDSLNLCVSIGCTCWIVSLLKLYFFNFF